MARTTKAQKKLLKHHTPSKVLTRSAARQSPCAEQQRQPQKCNKCPGRPLRSQCIHTRKGKEYLAQHVAEQSLERSQAEQSNEDPFSSSLPLTSSQGRSLATPAASLSRASQSASMATPATHTPAPQAVTVLTAHDLAQMSLRALNSASTSSNSLSSAPATRTSARNPYNGHVDGAYRGTEVYQIVRGHRLPSPISDNTRAVKKFTNAINSVIEKCEDISRETACWLFIGAQHSTARGGAISYASPRLHRDAAAQVGNIGTQFSSLTRNLINARTQENLELQRQLDTSRRQNEEMALQLQAVNSSQKELDRELCRYKSRYNLDS